MSWPGSEHAGNPNKANIVNPAKLDYVRANDTCIQCHSQGQPLKNPIEDSIRLAGRFSSGCKPEDFWKLEEQSSAKRISCTLQTAPDTKIDAR